MILFWNIVVYAFAVIGVLATFLIICFAICFAICVIKLQRESEVGAIDLDAVEGERNE